MITQTTDAINAIIFAPLAALAVCKESVLIVKAL